MKGLVLICEGVVWCVRQKASDTSGCVIYNQLAASPAMISDNVLTLTFVLPDAPLPGCNHDKTSFWQGDRLSVLPPSPPAHCVCVCVFIVVVCFAALIRPLIPECCDVVGVKSEALS